MQAQGRQSSAGAEMQQPLSLAPPSLCHGTAPLQGTVCRGTQQQPPQQTALGLRNPRFWHNGA